MTKKTKSLLPERKAARTIKKGVCRSINRFRCNSCFSSFCVNHGRKPIFWVQHTDGIPFRKLTDEHGISPAKVYLHVKEKNELSVFTRVSFLRQKQRAFSGLYRIVFPRMGLSRLLAAIHRAAIGKRPHKDKLLHTQ